MQPDRPPPAAATLTEHVDWMRALARCLVRDPADAEDLVQETYLAALGSPPDTERPPRPWLSQVLRNAFRTRLRRYARRLRRESAAGESAVPPPLAEEVLARTQLHQRLAALMTELPEPYRSALLLRFYEGRDSTEIARTYGVAAGTIRWRINEGLRRLREGLDDRAGGRQRWRALLLPLATSRPSRPVPVSPGATVPAAVAIGATALVALAGGWWCLRVQPPGARPPETPLATRLAGAPPNETKETTMTPEAMKRMAALLGTALPVLLAGSELRADAALVEEGVNWCVEMREKVFECKEAFADVSPIINKAPPERRKALRAKFMEEIAADGSGPLEPRKQKCRAMAGKLATAKPEEARAKLDGMKKLLAFCAAKEDCAARAECMGGFLRPGGAKQP